MFLLREAAYNGFPSVKRREEVTMPRRSGFRDSKERLVVPNEIGPDQNCSCAALTAIRPIIATDIEHLYTIGLSGGELIIVNSKGLLALFVKLQAEVKAVKADYPALKDDNAFVLWVSEAYLLGDRNKAFAGITGGPGDKTVDAAYTDERNGVIQLVQGKYHIADANDDLDLLKFAKVAADFWRPEFAKDLKVAGPGAKKHLLVAHKALHGKDGGTMNVKMYFATTGRVTPKCQKAAKRMVAKHGRTDLEVLDRPGVLGILAEWLEGASPPLPEMEIGVDGPHTLIHQERNTSLQGWIFTTTADELIRLFGRAEERLFARNVRGFLGTDGTINREISRTALKNPEHFWFLNNGITIVADEVEKRESGKQTRMHMKNPQVVNGQQTVRALVHAGRNTSRVLVRLIRLESPSAKEGMIGLVGDVVRATNRQNAIKAADLMSNDPEQVRLERELRKLNYAYERKRQTSTEFTQIAFISAVSACMYQSIRC
jgi:AIPR protein